MSRALRGALAFRGRKGSSPGVQASPAVAVIVGADGLCQERETRAFIARSRREQIPVIPVLLPDCPDSPQLTTFLEGLVFLEAIR